MNEIKTMKWMEIMKIPGTTKVQLSLLMILATSSVTSTVLQIQSQGRNISGESILHNVESLEVGNAELRVRVTGKSTTEVLTNLNPMLNGWAKRTLEEKSYRSTPD